MSERWWRDAVLYQVYPRSFADSDGDGIGDLAGLIDRLDHLEWLGIDGIWVSPVYPSPNADWGYDVSDHLAIHPELGTLDDAERLVAEADRRGIQVLFDLVPNHTSDRHAWFVDARSSRDAAHRDWYVWADPAPDGGPPNNWVSNFGGPAWTFDEASGQYYLHNFLAEQPDLDWWNEEVAGEFDRILRYWFDRGVAGFRIDVCHMIVKDRELRDNPPAGDEDHPMEQLRGQRQVYNADRPEVHEVLRRWRALADEYTPGRVLLGEVYLTDLERVARYLGERDDELHLAFNIPFVHSLFDPSDMRAIVERTEEVLPAHAWPTWTGSNHDAGRLASRWCRGDPRAVRCALTMLLTLRGTPVLYQGDEIGLPDVKLDYEDVKDPVGIRFHPYAGRDPGRTPMQWSAGPGAGFTEPGVSPWLPFGDLACNVADQRDDPDSVLHHCRRLLRLRRERADLRGGAYRSLASPEGTWVYRRGEATTVTLNMSDARVRVDGVEGSILAASQRRREGEQVAGMLELGAWESAVVGS